MRIYYLTGAQFALGNLALRRLKISRFSDLNDPFELLAVDLADKGHRAALRAMKDKLNENNGLICFSRSWSNPLLWGHYAEKHTGICLGFDIADERVSPVVYAKTSMKIKIDRRTNKPKVTMKVIRRLLRTKFFDWKYEDEVRVFVKLDHDTVESGLYFYQFSPRLVLREVVLGPRCELPIASVRAIVERFQPSVDVLKSRIAFRSFRVVEHKIATRSRSTT